MAVGEIILSAFLQALFAKLLEVKLKRVAVDLDGEVDGLRDTLEAIWIIIEDAENRQNNNRIKWWLQRLREESYNARDVLDEVEYEALRRDHVICRTVRNSDLVSRFNPKRSKFVNNVSNKIVEIRTRLEKLVQESRALNLREANGPARTSLETGSVGELNPIGRERDLNTILSCLFECSTASVDFISVIGKAGIGKTTLAQMVFKDESVVSRFHIRMWVHASLAKSDSFGEKELIKATIQSITREKCNIPSLDNMQLHLRQLLERKTYLLVLDGLLNDSPDFLHAVNNFLSRLGAYGSKVLITTQKRSIGKLIGTIYTHELLSISDNHCAQVIRRFAYSNRSSNTIPNLDRIIGMIVTKCNGLPLAAKRYGQLLSVENEREKWELISRKEVAQVIDNDIIQNLSPDVKRCFAYCSIFPKDYLFDKQQLIQLWLAQDFVQNEDEGSEYFDSMFRCSLFRLPPPDHSSTTKQEYLMDDDIRSRAQLISGEECYPDNSHTLSETARHASLLLSTRKGSVLSRLSRNSSSSSSHRLNMSVDIKLFYKAKGLYTLMLLAHPSNPVRMQILDNLAEKLQRLRSLDLSNTGLLELPSSVGGLKYLRYLALHNTRIKRLPDSLCELYLLQTLGLRNCYELIELPKGMRHLVNLRHLDLHLDDCSRRYGGLTSMPRKIGKLTNLYTFSRFVISKTEQCGLSQLRDMNNLHGSLTILGLEYVDRAMDATDASLDKKDHLQMLELLWGEGERDHAMDAELLLNSIRPNINIREIRIGDYPGSFLSSWICDPSFSSLAVLKLYNCKNLSELPPLGQLPFLKKLQLEGLPNWKSWSGRDERELTSLKELVIRDCFNLYRLCPSSPYLLRLEIHRCPRILGLPIFPSLNSLKVKDSGDWIWKSLSSLKSISSLSLEGMSSATLPMELQKCTSMHRLEIINFAKLHFRSDDLLPLRLSHFKIEQCPVLQILPLGLQLLEHLQVLQVRHCQGLLSLPPEMRSLRSLEYLELTDSPQLSFKLSDGLPARLQILIINNCQTLNQCLQQDWDNIRVPKVWIDGHLVVSAEAAHSGASASRGNANHS